MQTKMHMSKESTLPGCTESVAFKVLAKDQMLKITCIQPVPDYKVISTMQVIGKNSELKSEAKI